MGGRASRFSVGIGSAFLGAAFWGYSGACSQYLLGRFEITPAFITIVRAFIASALFALVIAATPRLRQSARMLLTAPRDRHRLLLFGLGLFGSQFTFVWSVSATNAGTATVLQSLSTVFIMGLTCIFTRRLPQWRELLGLACALIATWLIATGGDPSTFVLPPGGLIWGFVNASAVTLYLMVPRPLYERYATTSVIGLGMMLSWVIALIAWLIGGLWGNPPTVVELDLPGWLVLTLGVGVLGSFVAFGLYLFGVAIIGSVRGSLLGVAEPATAMVLATFWLGTAFTGADWLGLAFMVAMIGLVSTSGPRKPQ